MKLGIVVALVAAVGSVCLMDPQPVEACGMILERRDRSALLVAKAQKAMELRDYQAVVRTLSDASRASYAARTALTRRGQRLVATAVVRSGGEQFSGDRAHLTRRQRLLWAVNLLDKLEEVDDPRLRTARAEGLSQLYDRRAEAKRILEDLAHRDLITSPTAWAALAKLREHSGDVLGRNDALARCALMSADDEAECGPDAASLAGQPQLASL